MAINTSKVIVGGLVAGIVMNIGDFLLNTMLGDRMMAEANAFKAGMGDAMGQMDTNTIIGYVIMDLVIGMLLAYMYAAMRPRLGAGAKTAIIAGLILWIFGSIVSTNYLMMGIMSSGLWLTFGGVYLVILLVAALVAGALYKEEG